MQLTVESPENEKKTNKDEEVPMDDLEANENLVEQQTPSHAASH